MGISFLFSMHWGGSVAYVEFREQTGYPMIFLPLSCLPSHRAKWTLISSRKISICSWCALSPICLHPMFPWASLIFFSNSWSAGLVWDQCDVNQCKAVPGRVATELQRGICCDYWGPGDDPSLLKYTQQIWSDNQNLLKWRFRPRPRTWLAWVSLRALLKNRDSVSLIILTVGLS